MTQTVRELLDALRAHLAEFELPELCSVTVAPSSLLPQLSAQLTSQEPPQIATALLAWADTVAQPTAEAWRVPGGDAVHLIITGLLPGGASIQIYGGAPFSVHGLGADLAPGARSPLLLTALRHLAALREVPA